MLTAVSRGVWATVSIDCAACAADGREDGVEEVGAVIGDGGEDDGGGVGVVAGGCHGGRIRHGVGSAYSQGSRSGLVALLTFDSRVRGNDGRGAGMTAGGRE